MPETLQSKGFTYILSKYHTTLKVANINLILKVMKLRLRDIKQLVQKHITKKGKAGSCPSQMVPMLGRAPSTLPIPPYTLEFTGL